MTNELANFAQQGLGFALVFAVQLLLILALRKPVRARLGAVACYRLWLLPVLWLPCYLLGPALFAAIAQGLAREAGTDATYPLQQLMDIELLPFTVDLAAAPEAGAAGAGLPAWVFVALVWAAGTLAMIAWQGRRWLAFSRHVRVLATPLGTAERHSTGAAMHFDARIPVLRLRGINSAALYGVLNPVLLLPEGFNERYDGNQRHIVLAHEAVHLRRRDNAWNLCALLLIALFWTNPLVFIAWRYFRLDQELSCDALALARCSKEQQARYARTLVDSLAPHASWYSQPALSAWDNLRDIKERSLMIKQHLTLATRPATTLASLLALAVLGASLTVTFAGMMSPRAVAAETGQQARQAEAQARNVEQHARAVEEQARRVEQQSREVELQARQVEQQSREVEQQASRVEQQSREVEQLSRNINQRTGRILSETIRLLNADSFTEARALLAELDLELLSKFERSRYEQLMFNLDMNDENYPGARAHLLAALDSGGLNEKESAQMLYQLAQLHVQEENYPAAVEALESWIASQESPHSAAYYLLAASYYYMDDFTAALPHAQKAVELAGDEPKEPWLQMLNALYMKLGQYDAAAPVATRLAEMFPGKATYRTQLEELRARSAPAADR